MAAYAFTGSKWGDARAGTSATVYWSFATYNDSNSIYQFDAQITNETYRDLVRQAFDAWENVANIDFVEVADGTSSQIRLGWDAIDGSYNTVGQAQYYYYPATQSGQYNSLTEAAIRFDTAERWSTDKNYVGNDVNFYSVAVHEIGHAIGLAHVDDINSIMYARSNDTVRLSSGDIQGIQSLYGAAPSRFNATNGNDIFTATAGDDYIDGLGGRDTVVYAGPGSNFSIGVSNGVITVVGSSRDELVNIERVQFTNGTMAFDNGAGQVAGSAYRLYQAAFDRVPDAEGLGYWIGRMDAGVRLNAVADSFINSPEFRSTYGTQQTVSNAKYVELLYTHTLGRNYDQSGFNYWVDKLNASQTNRGDLLAFFSESNENQARVADAIHDGIWYV